MYDHQAKQGTTPDQTLGHFVQSESCVVLKNVPIGPPIIATSESSTRCNSSI